MPDRARVEAMRDAARRGEGFDVLVVTTGSEAAAAWWRARLQRTRGELLRASARVAVVVEPWPAGNGLGTLRAVDEAERALDVDLGAHLRDGGTAAVVHTAGKGTRLAPLSLAEHGDKPRVRLPGLVRAGDESVSITLLEAVLRQTAPLAAGRAGRLSVFWGDQLFVPDVDPGPARHPVVISARRLPDVEASTWTARDLGRYGLVVVGDRGGAVLLEKVDRPTFARLLETGLDTRGGTFASLGAFHVSADALGVLREAFAPDLAARGRANADPHWWMPLGLTEDEHVALRAARGEDPERARAAWHRMHALRPALGTGALGVEDLGERAWFWDFGGLASYAAHLDRLLADGPEADGLRAFFGVERRDGSVVAGGAVTGAYRDSVLVDVRGEVDVDGALCIGVHAPRIEGGGLAYAIDDADPLVLRPGDALADVPLPEGPVRVRARLGAPVPWDRIIPGNPSSFATLYERTAGS